MRGRTMEKAEGYSVDNFLTAPRHGLGLRLVLHRGVNSATACTFLLNEKIETPTTSTGTCEAISTKLATLCLRRRWITS